MVGRSHPTSPHVAMVPQETASHKPLPITSLLQPSSAMSRSALCFLVVLLAKLFNAVWFKAAVLPRRRGSAAAWAAAAPMLLLNAALPALLGPCHVAVMAHAATVLAWCCNFKVRPPTAPSAPHLPLDSKSAPPCGTCACFWLGCTAPSPPMHCCAQIVAYLCGRGPAFKASGHSVAELLAALGTPATIALAGTGGCSVYLKWVCAVEGGGGHGLSMVCVPA